MIRLVYDSHRDVHVLFLPSWWPHRGWRGRLVGWALLGWCAYSVAHMVWFVFVAG